ncbi:uncharacterized protein LOC133031476 [Cannabis sativa]|uniref:uncharacterized protein LOC133031476 n=1 Tax=Cannabis sativa TaxID=3483 RepID=UPI0029CA2D99|nr:uncharacterized protein LOC133031476 [Cannabis sativa]
MSRLDYYRNEQQHIRSELYKGIVDTVTLGERDASNVGKRIILQSSCIGGPRDMRKRYMEAMALVQRYGKPDIFLTMTCNPNWKEITNELSQHEEAQNRPDLVARVFHAKLEELKDKLFKREIFGKVAAYVYVIEHQKRGLPHAHFLIILQGDWRLHAPEYFDEIVSAEIPDKNTNMHLHNAVVKHMMHGPCGDLNRSNVCMKGNPPRCKSNYPKNYAPFTSVGNDCFPIYRRRNNGTHVKDVKYLYKYIYKGHDRVAFNLVSEPRNDEVDEIHQFQMARWIAAPEAMWRIYGFIVNEMYPSVYSLHLHLEHQHPVTFRADQDLSNIATSEHFKKSMLTEFFVLNRTDQNANALPYKQIPESYVWNQQHKIWSTRRKKTVIGRIVTTNPFEGERYYLRILLNHVRGPLSFEDLRTVNGVLAPTYREAATMLGLLQRDNCLEDCLHEASLYQAPSSLRQLFATILVYCNPTNPRDLWEHYEEEMSADLKSEEDSLSIVRNKVLKSISSTIESMGKDINSYQLLDEDISFDDDEEFQSREINDELGVEYPKKI